MESFSITSVGQLSMTGPIIVSFPQLQDDPNSKKEIITMLIHWNPGMYKDQNELILILMVSKYV